MYLWLLEQDYNNGYDTYDSAVVVAADIDAAKLIHPSGAGCKWSDEAGSWMQGCVHSYPDSSWAPLSKIEAKIIGVPSMEHTAGEVIIASFNAG